MTCVTCVVRVFHVMNMVDGVLCLTASLLLLLSVNHLKYSINLFLQTTWWLYLIYILIPLKGFPGYVTVLDTRFVREKAWAFKLLRATLKRMKWPRIVCAVRLCFVHVAETLIQRSVWYWRICTCSLKVMLRHRTKCWLHFKEFCLAAMN